MFKKICFITLLASAFFLLKGSEAQAFQDEFGEPDLPSVYKVDGEIEDGAELPELSMDLLKDLSAEARGGKSTFPAEVLKDYDKALSNGSSSGPGLNNAILSFCKANMGSKVGNGQCAVLLSEAIKSIKAKRFPPSGVDADYVWGTFVCQIEANKLGDVSKIRPGDLLQFRDASFKGTRKSGNSTRWWSYSAGHHSAVVTQVGNSGNLISVAESNINGVLQTQRGYYDFKDLKSGWIRVYRATK